MKKTLLTLLTPITLVATAALAPLAANAQALVSERSLSLTAAMELATAALEHCRKDGYKVTITVLNRHARPAVCLLYTSPSPRDS